MFLFQMNLFCYQRCTISDHVLHALLQQRAQNHDHSLLTPVCLSLLCFSRSRSSFVYLASLSYTLCVTVLCLSVILSESNTNVGCEPTTPHARKKKERTTHTTWEKTLCTFLRLWPKLNYICQALSLFTFALINLSNSLHRYPWSVPISVLDWYDTFCCGSC